MQNNQELLPEICWAEDIIKEVDTIVEFLHNLTYFSHC